MFDKNYEQILYVGASRARHRLYMIANLTDEECVMLLRKKDVMKARRPKKELASLINAKYIRRHTDAGLAVSIQSIEQIARCQNILFCRGS